MAPARPTPLLLAALLPLACAAHVPAPAPAPIPSAPALPAVATPPAPPPCSPLDAIRREAEQGSLRRALRGLEAPGTSFCAPQEAALLRARVLVELGRYEEARSRLADVDATIPEARDLKTRLGDLMRPRSAAEIRDAARVFRRATEMRGPQAAEVFLLAWAADPPSGLALIGAGLAMGRGLDPLPREVRRLFERGVAELELEVGAPAYAGVPAPPICTGHFSNYLEATWLPDSAHAVVTCLDAKAIVDLAPASYLARVAQLDPDTPVSVDVARLPRLKFVPQAPAGSGAPPPVSVESAQDGVIAKRVDASGRLAWSTRIEKPGPESFTYDIASAGNGRVVFVVKKPFDGQLFRDGEVTALDAASGRILGRFHGNAVRALDDGRISVRGHDGAVLLDRSAGKRSVVAGRDAEVSPDGKRVLFTKLGEASEDFHPYYPYLSDLAHPRHEEDLRPVLGRPPLDPAEVTWPRLDALQVTGCGGLGTMSNDCERPEVSIGGRSYGASEEVACLGGGGPERRGPRSASCLDPRGPVHATHPWSPALVCRIGPHVLPFAVCADSFSGD